jgi:hypothetical protein
MIPQVLAYELIVAYQAYKSARMPTEAHTFIINSDSRPLGIDNRASTFISGDITGVEGGPLHDANKAVKDFGGT